MANANFPIVTLTTWAHALDDPIVGDTIAAQADTMYNEGKTDNVSDMTFDPPLGQDAPTGRIIYVRRNWIDVNAANQWITFIESLGLSYLVSIVIENQP